MRCFARTMILSWSVFVVAILLPVSGWAANRKVDCGGGTAGAFSSLQAAIDSLDRVGPHQIAVVTTTPCNENVRIMDRQRLAIIATSPSGGTFITSQAGASGDVMTISGSTGITLTLLGFTGGLTYMSPPLVNYLSSYNLAFGLLGQGSVMLWLLAMGVNAQRWKEQASAAGERQ